MLTRPTSKGWLVGLCVAFLLTMMLLFAIGYLFVKGVGIWGIKIPIGWGFAIVNFVWWIGIGHAGTLISAILLLLRQSWRNSINRFAEAMTLFAVACAGHVPAAAHGPSVAGLLAVSLSQHHELLAAVPQPAGVGRVRGFDLLRRSPCLFWFIGLIPDLATLRDRSENRWAKMIYGMLAMGWRGSARHWARYETAYLLLAGLATPLVLSVHTVVSFDFAIAIVPGWHTTIFPPYFVAGAIYSGFAMVLMLAIPIRKIYGLEDFITERHLQNSAKVMLATGLIVAYGYAIEALSGTAGTATRSTCCGTGCTGPTLRAIIALLLQYLAAAVAVDQEDSAPVQLAVPDFRCRCPGRHVAGAVRHRGGQPAPRLPEFVLGHVLPDALGLDDLHRHDWHVLAAMFLFVRILPMISIFEMRTLLPEAEVKE